MLSQEKLKAILTSMLDAISDDPKPDWKDSLGDAAALVEAAFYRAEHAYANAHNGYGTVFKAFKPMKKDTFIAIWNMGDGPRDFLTAIGVPITKNSTQAASSIAWRLRREGQDIRRGKRGKRGRNYKKEDEWVQGYFRGKTWVKGHWRTHNNKGDE